MKLLQDNGWVVGRIKGSHTQMVKDGRAVTADTAYGAVVPDLPGCFSAGDTYDEALSNARDAIELHVEYLPDSGQAVPPPSTIDVLVAHENDRGWIWARSS